MTRPLPSRRTLRALPLMTVWPRLTWPSPPITTRPSLRTIRMVVARQRRSSLSWPVMHASSRSQGLTCRRPGRFHQWPGPDWAIPGRICVTGSDGGVRARDLREGARAGGRNPSAPWGSRPCAPRRLRARPPKPEISVAIALDGTGHGHDRHRLWASSTTCSSCLPATALFDITVAAEGDLHVDQHHTAEDVGHRPRPGCCPGARRPRPGSGAMRMRPPADGRDA